MLFEIRQRKSSGKQSSAFLKKKKLPFNIGLIILILMLLLATRELAEARVEGASLSSGYTVTVLDKQDLPIVPPDLTMMLDRPLESEPMVTPIEKYAESQKPVLPQGTLLVVNKTMFALVLYQDGQKIKTYSAGLGKKKPETETPFGQFEVISRSVDPSFRKDASTNTIPGGDPQNPLGPRWLGLNAGINVPDSIGIHGTTAGADVGRAQTEGCIQLSNDDIFALYEKITIGTPVLIGTTEQLEDWGI